MNAPLEWRGRWLTSAARQTPGHLVAAVALLVGASLLVLVFLPAGFGAVLLAALLVSLDEALFEVAYRVDAAGIRTRTRLHTRRLDWDEVRRVRETRHGVLVEAGVRRRLHLLVAEADRDRLVATIEAARADATRTGAAPPAEVAGGDGSRLE